MSDSLASGASAPPVLDASKLANTSSSLWDRISTWASDNKATVYTVAGITLVVTGAGAVYYFSSASQETNGEAAERRKARKERKRSKKDSDKAEQGVPEKQSPAPPASVESEEELPQITEESVAALSEQEKKDYAAKLKAAGNKAYGSKDYNKAIDLYGQALLCKSDPVFYSNRAACWNAMSNWDKVIEDTTAALNLDAEYVKALNRRANAYEQIGKFSEALLDYTASCIIDAFRNDSSAQAVERLLKKVAEAKAADMLKSRPKKLPSPTFVSNYLQSFRHKGLPEGLERSVELDEDSGKGQLRKGLLAIQKRSGEGYADASEAFDKSIELGGLDNFEALAYNMRGTFRYLKGFENAIDDLNKSLELDKGLIQSYVKRASMHLESGDRDAAKKDFDTALEQDARDPDIFYHRAQLNFILSEFGEAAKDYQKSIDLDKDFIFSHIQLGVTQYKMGSIASSMATFRRCMKNFDKVPDVYNYYGELLLDQQKYQEAIEKFETAVELERKEHVTGMNVLPLINKALALFQWKQDFKAAEELCQKALLIDPECDIAVATMAQLLLQQGSVTQALTCFERAAELSRTEGETVNALSYAEATRTQLEVQQKYPQLASRLQSMGMGSGAAAMR